MDMTEPRLGGVAMSIEQDDDFSLSTKRIDEITDLFLSETCAKESHAWRGGLNPVESALVVILDNARDRQLRDLMKSIDAG